MQLWGDDVSAEMEAKCGDMGTKMKGSEKEKGDESVTAHEDGEREGSLYGDILSAEQE